MSAILPGLYLPAGVPWNSPSIRLREHILQLFSHLNSRSIDTARLSAAQFASLLIAIEEDRHSEGQVEVTVTCDKCENETTAKVWGSPVDIPLSLPVIPSALLDGLPRLSTCNKPQRDYAAEFEDAKKAWPQ